MKNHQQGGFAILEALIAVLVLAIGLIGTVGMQTRAYSALSDATNRTEAIIAIEKLQGLMVNNRPAVWNGDFSMSGAVPAKDGAKAWYNETIEKIPGAVIKVVNPKTISVTTGVTQIDVSIQWTRKQGGQSNTQSTTLYI